MDDNQPILSVVTPTIGNFSEYWLEQFLAIQGNVELILVYPPGVIPVSLDDPRVKIFYSPYKGETAQRFVGLLNASGKYVISLDDDDYLHPDVLQLTTSYFDKYTDSWVLRLSKKNIDYLDEENIKSPWQPFLHPTQLQVAKRKNKDEDKYIILQEIPIAPLENKFNIALALFPYGKRKDHHGPHIENFNNKVWKTEMVKKALVELSKTMRIGEVITWLPSWSLDRLLGLFLQANFFQQGICVGHWMPEPEQIRYIEKPYPIKVARINFPADALLAKNFPQYGYFWNLFFEELYNAIKAKIKNILNFKK